MIEMFDVNNLNASTAILTNITETQEDVNQSNNDSYLPSGSVSASASASLFTSSSSALATNDTNSMLLADIVVNTTAVVIDYATQWLSTTIATTLANLTSLSNESNSIPPTTSSSSLLTTSSTTENVLNYTTAATAIAAGMEFASIYNVTNVSFLSNYDATDTDSYTTTAATLYSLDDSDNFYHECHPNSPSFNCSRRDFVLFMMGPQRLPIHKLITIIYGLLFFGGIIGNVFVCFVIFKHPTMHTATNYYLFNLAVSDLIYLIFGLPPEVFLYWHQYPYLFGLSFCKVRAYISEASTYVSVLTIVAFSMERYLAICHPLYLYKMSGFKRALYIIILLWLVSIISAIPFYVYTYIKYLKYPPDQNQMPESGICTFDTPENFPLFEVSSLFSFFVPMFSMFYFYGRMGIKICSRTTQQLGVQQGSVHRESRHQQSRKAVIRMLAAVVMTFFVCWLPFHFQRLWFVHGEEHKYYQEVNEWLFSITGVAYYLSCIINPILYNVMSHRYRVAFLDILCRKRRNMHYNNGLARDQSSFRETTVASSLYNNSIYNRGHSIRDRSLRIVNNVKDRSSIKSNNISWKNSIYNTPCEKNIRENHATNLNGGSGGGTTAVVVCGVNGRTKVFTENEVQVSLLKKNNETCI